MSESLACQSYIASQARQDQWESRGDTAKSTDIEYTQGLFLKGWQKNHQLKQSTVFELPIALETQRNAFRSLYISRRFSKARLCYCSIPRCNHPKRPPPSWPVEALVLPALPYRNSHVSRQSRQLTTSHICHTAFHVLQVHDTPESDRENLDIWPIRSH